MSDKSQKIPVTVVIPVKNEKKNLPQCLRLLSDFSEVIIVDSNSTDSTPEIVKELGYELINFVWDGHFPKKRNWVLRNMALKNEWVLFLDADEFVTKEFKSELRCLLNSSEYNGFWISYQNHFLGKNMRHGIKMKKLALFKKDKGEYELIDEDVWSHLDMEIHEHPIIKGKIGIVKSPIIHIDFKGLSHYIAKHNEYSTWEAHRYLNLLSNKDKKLTFRQKIKYKLLDTWAFGFLYFILNYIFYAGFLDGRIGYVFSIYKMQYFFNIKTKIFELKSAKDLRMEQLL
jgi:glycosyltransferase involved in cell wall biosynthesis